MTSREMIQKLCKWRAVFAGWQLGTRSKEDPESQAVRDHREVTILLRAEVNALTCLLLRHEIFTHAELDEQVRSEAEYLDKAYQEKFPGFSADLNGVVIDVAKAAETTKNWRP
jgi:hypothetical protein